MNSAHLMLLPTLVFFGIYIADVLAGALWKAAFLSNVASVLLLILTSVCFTVAVVRLERREQADADSTTHSKPLD